MPVYQAWGVVCDACGSEHLIQFASRREAVKVARGNGWYVGYGAHHTTALCPDCDGENE